MGKGKPRRDPNKKQNNYGNWCSACDEIDGKLYCEAMQGTNATKIYKGNPHNCVKVKYHKEATKSDIRKINDRR